MLLILSPAKKLDFKSIVPIDSWSENRFLIEAFEVVQALRQLSVGQLSQTMGISQPLAQLNFERYRNWQLPFTPDNARQAIYAFNGDAYQGLNAHSLSGNELDFAQKHLRILSALYGVIRPFDLIQPYRIEMGMSFSCALFDSLYRFWENKIADSLKVDLDNQGDTILVNLASEEYFKVVEHKLEGVRIITPVFKEYSNGLYKIVSQKAKRARGLMSRFIIQNQISDPDELKLFDLEGYFFNERMSDGDVIVFTR